MYMIYGRVQCSDTGVVITKKDVLMRYRFSMCAFGALSLAACSSFPGSGTTRVPAPGAPVATTSSTRVEPPAPIVQKAPGFQIEQCYSAGAPKVGINYPPGWSRRVSRAETEDELLGGGSETLSAENAFAQPVGAVSFSYPQGALNPPTEGICEIKFDLSRRGEPSNIVSACSSDLFLEAASEAVAGARFKPVRINGSAAKAVNMTYNMKFCLAD